MLWNFNVHKIWIFRNKLECLLDYAWKLAIDKQSSLLRKFVNYVSKQFHNIGPGTGSDCYKTFLA